MKFIDLYAGIGGFRFALEELGHECVFSAEIDKYAIETYENNFPGHKAFFNMDSLQEMSVENIIDTIPNHDILVAGFPCQSFSIGGKKEGFKDILRGTQFFNILLILDIFKPKYLLLENVKGILKHDNGRTLKIIKNELSKRGYKLPTNPAIISPTHLGIPQRRERVFLTSILNQKTKEIPIPEMPKKYKKILVKNNKIKDYIVDEKLAYILSSWNSLLEKLSDQNIPILWLDFMKTNEIDSMWQPWKMKYIENMREFYKKNKIVFDKWINDYSPFDWTNKKYRKLEWISGDLDKDLKNKIITLRESGIRVSKPLIFPTLVAMVETPIIYDDNIKNFRWITVKEMGNLQSFPKKFKPHPNKQKAYKMFGNSVNVEVVKYVAERLLK